jgi:TetR/AcrR family transcriptional regulator
MPLPKIPAVAKFFCAAAGEAAAPAPKRERRKDARPGELLAAALDLFVEKGFAATRAEEVAQRAGVSKGTLFLYFASKEELFKAVVRENISKHYPQWLSELENYTGNTQDMLRMCLASWWAQIGATKASGISKLMMSEGANFPDLAAFYRQEVVEPGQALIARILARGVARGEFRAVDPRLGVYNIMAPMLFMALWKHSGLAAQGVANTLPPEVLLASVAETLLHGLCVPGQPETSIETPPQNPQESST